jgi:hypothetical protein
MNQSKSWLKSALCVLLAAVVALAAFDVVLAQDAEDHPEPAAADNLPFDVDHFPAGYDNFYRELQAVFRRFYPQVTSHHLGSEMHFEFNTRVFLIHLPAKTGHWQDPSAIRGPMQGGIHCDITIGRGRWSGAAAVPQNFDRFYFTSRLAAPHDPERDLFLTVHLDTPADVSPEFIAAFTERINSFGRYLQSSEGSGR